MNNRSTASTAFRPFRTSSIAHVHSFFAQAAGTRCVVPMLHVAGIPAGGAHLPEADVDVVVAWPRSVTRQAAIASATLRGRHLVLVTMRSPIVADDYALTLIFNDSGTITVIDELALYTCDSRTFWVCPTGGGMLHFLLRRDGLFPKLSSPWRDQKQRRAGFKRAADLLTSKLLGEVK